jgi:gas vesicle protein GvpA/GvpJ/GvpM family
VKRTKPRHSTVPRGKPPRTPARPAPPRRVAPPRPAHQVPHRRKAARIITTSDASLLDVIDSLLNKGVVLNADIILALANVDLVYVRLSALLCAADRVLKP